LNEEYAITESELSPDMLELYEAACAVREHAYAPYSGFRVGAALRTADGRVYIGVNVENASFPVTICAERGALMAAVADGARQFSSLAVVTDASEPAAPCGMCRQMLVEFGVELQVLTAGRGGPSALLPLTELLPLAFVRSSFELRSLVMPALKKTVDN
jgi:cytidine deaminase